MVRPFSHNKDLNCKDYINNKRSVAIIKGTISQNLQLNNSLDYTNFLQLAQSFFRYTYQKNFNKNIPWNIKDSYQTKNTYDKLIHHIKSCSYCKYCSNQFKLIQCCNIQDTLYLLYSIENNKTKNQNGIYYPRKLNVNDWCKLNPRNDINSYYQLPIPCKPCNNLNKKDNNEDDNEDDDNEIETDLRNKLGKRFTFRFIDEDPNSIKDEILIIAFFSNTSKVSSEKVFNIEFKTIQMGFEYFQTLFYNSNLGNFHITNSNRLHTLLLLSSQLYLNVPFVLSDTIYIAFEEILLLSRNTLPREKIISVNKEILNLLSFLDLNEKLITLNWYDDIIPKLTTDNIICPSFEKDEAYVTFCINCIYYCEPLDISLSMNLYLKTGIPGYRNMKYSDKLKARRSSIHLSSSNNHSLDNRGNVMNNKYNKL